MLKTQRIQCDMEAIDDLFPYDTVVITHWSEVPDTGDMTCLEYCVKVENVFDETFWIHAYTDDYHKVSISIQQDQSDVLGRMFKPASVETLGLAAQD